MRIFFYSVNQFTVNRVLFYLESKNPELLKLLTVVKDLSLVEGIDPRKIIVDKETYLKSDNIVDEWRVTVLPVDVEPEMIERMLSHDSAFKKENVVYLDRFIPSELKRKEGSEKS